LHVGVLCAYIVLGWMACVVTFERRLNP